VSEIQAEPLRITTIIGEGMPDAIVLTSDNTIFQPPDAEERARRYVALATDLEDATRLLRELYLAVARATLEDPTHHVVANITAVAGLEARQWLLAHGQALEASQ
jgi:hypothetical protein